ncbi:TolC family protein [Telluribacter sp. SYSU D00476]|uniref:TolC family protein n=1 Tax=Telluribacter sp. SYSU D00476 TaxID=2811430 RepID=UPI001FF6DD2B|nr:TolC family protein [Telluribacter sp. SYSU D00476]
MNSKSNWLLLIALLASLGVQAQNPLTLKESIEYGLKNHNNIRIADYQTEVANQQAREAISGYLPQVNGSSTLDNNIKLQSTLMPAGIFGPEPTRVAFGSKYQTTATASAEQVIYDKSLLIGIKASKPNQVRAELNAKQTKEEIIYQISNSYYQVFVAQEQVALLRDNLERTQQVLNVLKLQRDNGVIQPIEYDRTQVSYNTIQSQLIQAENSLVMAQNQLKFQMGMPLETPLALQDSLILTKRPSANTQGFEARNLTEFQMQETALELQRLDQQRIQAGYLPKVSATARYGSLALGNELLPSFQKFTGFGSIGLRLTVPIFDGFRRSAQIQQSRLNISILEEQQKLSSKAYQLQFSNAMTQLQRAQLNLDNDNQNVELARKVYDVTLLQYKQGTRPLTDLINAENSYRESQTNYIRSLVNAYQARLELESSQGTLLNFYNQL